MGDISTGELCNGRYKGVTFLAIAMAVVLCTRRGVGGGVDGLQSNFSPCAQNLLNFFISIDEDADQAN